MTQHSLTTHLDPYSNTMSPKTHSHRHKAFHEFVTALLGARRSSEGALARYFLNLEAASRRLTCRLHNPRLKPQAQARMRNKKEHWEYWHLTNNHLLSAHTMA